MPALDRLRGQLLMGLSTGGLFIKTDRSVPLGSEVTIDLLAPGSDVALELTGKVVRLSVDEAAQRAGASGVGVQFESLTHFSSWRGAG